MTGSRTRLAVLLVIVISICVAGTAKVDFIFGEPTNLGPTVNSSETEWCPSISADGLELYFGSSRSIPGLDPWNLWVVTRQTQDDDWGEPVSLGPDINSASEEGFPQLSPDGLELYFYSKRPGGHGSSDIWVARRPTVSDPWGPATNLGPPINSSAHDSAVTITADGLELFVSRTPSGAGGFDIWIVSRQQKWHRLRD